MKERIPEVKEVLTVDQCRAGFMANMAQHFIDYFLEHKYLPDGMNRNVLKQTSEQLARCKREVRRTVPPKDLNYLERNLDSEKMANMANLIDLMARIGVEEKDSRYEELMGLVVDLMDVLFYAQTTRRHLYFYKYQALLKFVAEEARADINGQPGQVLYQKNAEQMFLRMTPHILSTEIK